jgi:hypothetical protein
MNPNETSEAYALRDAMPPVPADKVRLCEYRDVDARLIGIVTTLARGEAVNCHGIRKPMALQSVTRGYQCAGSVLRWQDRPIWRVRVWQNDGTTTGLAFKTEAEARAQYDAWSGATAPAPRGWDVVDTSV